jgi:hypothetical protein
VILAAATAVCTLTLWIAVPEAASAKPPVKGQPLASLKTVYSDSRFWRVAPLSATCAGTTLALQSLWAAPWLTDVTGCRRPVSPAISSSWPSRFAAPRSRWG